VRRFMSRWLWRASWLLLPVALVVRFVSPGQHVLIFAISCLSLMPLAKAMGDATEDLAERLGPGLGSLLNATFGNAAELIVGLLALREGHVALVKGSITGSILGNLLLVAGGAIVVAGTRFPAVRFNRVSAGATVSTLFLAVVALAVPTILSTTAGVRPRALLLSEEIAAVLVVMYGLSLLFQLRTQARVIAASDPRPFFPATPGEAAAVRVAEEHEAPPNVWWATGRLLLAGAATGLAGEVLVGSLEGTLQTVHLPETFVGIVIIAIVGNAAEHSSALAFASRGEMDVALGIAWESSKQIALLVAPVLVFAGLVLGAPMDLNFSRFEVTAIGLAVLATAIIALDGETHWLEGAFLMAVYAVLAIGFYFVGS
jgi:Ca2+:H+ antiporter